MEAPTYPPAAAFEQPLAGPFQPRLRDLSIAELVTLPAAWEIVLKHVPALAGVVNVPQIKPYLGEMTVPSMMVFAKLATPEALAAADEELARLLPLSVAAP